MTTRYKTLYHFIQNEMRMSHVYQPTMLIELLDNHGRSTVTEIAHAILMKDISQIEYYKQVTNKMPGRVLKEHNIVEKVKKDEKSETAYLLKGYDELSNEEIDALIVLCVGKIEEFIERRKDGPWKHSKNSSAYISGSIRYNVLKRAKFRCLLCGISAEDKAIQVDHILPRNKRGTDDEANLQALCYSCNAMKRDRDDSDFRGVADSYGHREAGCLFCEIPEERIVASNELCYSVRDLYPVTPHHTLVIPKRHVLDFFDLYQPERNAVHFLLSKQKEFIRQDDSTIAGFNIGINIGKEAGQTIFHCHVHLIPRRPGDTPQPRGGVRGVIPGRQSY